MVFTIVLIYLVEYLPQVFKAANKPSKRLFDEALMVVALSSQVLPFCRDSEAGLGLRVRWTRGDIFFGPLAVFSILW